MGKLSGRWVFLAFSHCLCLSLFRCSLLACSEAPTSAPQPQEDFGMVPAQNKAEGGTSKPPDKAPVSKERRGGRTPTQETLRIIRGGGSRASDPPTQLKTHPPRPPPPLQNSSYKRSLVPAWGGGRTRTGLASGGEGGGRPSPLSPPATPSHVGDGAAAPPRARQPSRPASAPGRGAKCSAAPPQASPVLVRPPPQAGT